ncbi:unnamed protein product, partial [Staurois parvus]
IGAVHRELACFQVISSPHYSVVLGYPWLQRHNPTFDWRSAEILSWSPQCGAVASVAFLGYIISAVGSFSMDPEKVSAVLQWPCPSGLWSIQHFLGFANYYRKFIRNFSHAVQ